jgi:hypothetical protein
VLECDTLGRSIPWQLSFFGLTSGPTKRPSSRAANQRDELAPLHLTAQPPRNPSPDTSMARMGCACKGPRAGRPPRGRVGSQPLIGPCGTGATHWPRGFGHMADGPTIGGGHVRSRDRTGTSVLSDRDRRSRSWRSAPGQVWLLSVVKRSRIARYEAFSICEGFRMLAAANGSARAGHLAGWPRNARRPGRDGDTDCGVKALADDINQPAHGYKS